MSDKIELTEEEIADIEKLAAYLPISKIADYLNIPERVFHNLKKKNKYTCRLQEGCSKN
jgi:hypothetical protein